MIFSGVNEHPFLKPLVENWEVIRDEYLNVTDGEKVPWAERCLYNYGWSVFGFFSNGQDFPEGKARCPRTYELVKAVPGLHLAGFSILKPWCQIYPHVGYTDKVWRSHLGLVCPDEAWISVGGETRFWRDGELFVFDDSVRHSACNDSPSERAILIVDFEKGSV